MKKSLPVAILFCVAIVTIQVMAQQAEHPGLKLYRQGKNAEAVGLLSEAIKQNEFKSDATIWNFLGLAYLAVNDAKKSRKPFEQAVKLRPNNSIYHSNLAYAYLLFRQMGKARSESKKAIEHDPKNVTAYYLQGSANLWELKLNDAMYDAEQMVMIDPADPQGYILKSDILVAELGQKVMKGSDVKDEIKYLKQAADALRVGVEKSSKSSNHKMVEDEFEAIGSFYDYFSKDRSTSTLLISDAEPGVTPLKILRKPRPGYTDSARSANVQGTIKIAVLFGANGEVQQTLVLNRLGNGLDERAAAAARKIEFEPMTKDGKPVSVVKIVEYSFSIY